MTISIDIRPPFPASLLPKQSRLVAKRRADFAGKERLMKRSKVKLVSLTLAIAAFIALAPKPASAETMALQITPVSYTLTLTELSDSVLQLAYTGPGGNSSFSVPNNTSPDHWTIQLLSQTITLNNFEYDFAEPEEIGEVNVVSHSTDLYGTIFVVSDLPIAMDNGGYIAAVTTIGSDGGVPINLVFIDQAQAAEANGVPDGGSTLVLLASAMAALVVIRRIRVPQLAYSHR